MEYRFMFLLVVCVLTRACQNTAEMVKYTATLHTKTFSNATDMLFMLMLPV